MNTDRHYAKMADEVEGRDHDVRNKYAGRIVQSEGAFGRAWLKFHPGQQLVWIDDADGKPRALTPKQYQVLVAALDMIDGVGITMRALALQLEVAPSTVSRALTKLAAWGLIGYVCGRGRFPGLVIFRRVKDDGLDRFRKAAQARVRSWYEAAHRHLLRTKSNVATRYSWKEIESHGYGSVYVDVRNATLTRPWTPQELREAGII